MLKFVESQNMVSRRDDPAATTPLLDATVRFRHSDKGFLVKCDELADRPGKLPALRLSERIPAGDVLEARHKDRETKRVEPRIVKGKPIRQWRQRLFWFAATVWISFRMWLARTSSFFSRWFGAEIFTAYGICMESEIHARTMRSFKAQVVGALAVMRCRKPPNIGRGHKARLSGKILTSSEKLQRSEFIDPRVQGRAGSEVRVGDHLDPTAVKRNCCLAPWCFRRR